MLMELRKREVNVGAQASLRSRVKPGRFPTHGEVATDQSMPPPTLMNASPTVTDPALWFIKRRYGLSITT